MASETELDIRIIHLEDQLYRMNVVLADHQRIIDELTTKLSDTQSRLGNLERLLDSPDFIADGPSNFPPDGSNR